LPGFPRQGSVLCQTKHPNDRAADGITGNNASNNDQSHDRPPNKEGGTLPEGMSTPWVGW
ncbi:MAG: hypothetical protein WC340_19465, partial [Kiritimatiellia bacterium]